MNTVQTEREREGERNKLEPHFPLWNRISCSTFSKMVIETIMYMYIAYTMETGQYLTPKPVAPLLVI